MGAVAGIPRTRGQVTSGSGAASLRRAPTVRRGARQSRSAIDAPRDRELACAELTLRSVIVNMNM
jgi:hypothetical protein